MADLESQIDSSSSSAYLIPNIVHFIHIYIHRSFSLWNYLAVLSVYTHQKPDIIYLYYTVHEKNNVWWTAVIKLVTLVKIDDVKEYRGIKLNCPQYQADVIRLQKLIEKGGIYLDTDILTLKSYNPLRNYECVLGGEGYKNHIEGLYTSDLNILGSISNAVILSKPNHRFIRHWLDIFPLKFRTGSWAYHAVTLPLELVREDPTWFHVEPVESFIPFDFRRRYVFIEADDTQYRIFQSKIAKSYCFHLWENIWRKDGTLLRITPQYLKRSKSLFACICNQYLDTIYRLSSIDK